MGKNNPGATYTKQALHLLSSASSLVTTNSCTPTIKFKKDQPFCFTLLYGPSKTRRRGRSHFWARTLLLRFSSPLVTRPKVLEDQAQMRSRPSDITRRRLRGPQINISPPFRRHEIYTNKRKLFFNFPGLPLDTSCVATRAASTSSLFPIQTSRHIQRTDTPKGLQDSYGRGFSAD